MASKISFSDLANPRFSAVEALNALRSFDEELPSSEFDKRNFSDAVLSQYYNLCLKALLISAGAARDPIKWAKENLHKHPHLRQTAATNTVANRALAFASSLAASKTENLALKGRVSEFEGVLGESRNALAAAAMEKSSLTTKISELEGALGESRKALDAEITYRDEQLEAADMEISSLTTKASELEGALGESRNELAAAADKISSLREKIRGLKADLHNSKAEGMQLGVDIFKIMIG